jgi:cellulose synthase (UDP-forming)
VWGTNTILGRGFYRHVTVEQFNLLKMFLFLRASTTLFWPRSLAFKVTPKSVGMAPEVMDRSELRPHIAALAAVLGGLAIGVANLGWGLSAQYTATIDVVFTTLLWCLFNATMLAIPIVGVLRRVYNRSSYRFPVGIPAAIATEAGSATVARVVDLSREGARLESISELGLGSCVKLLLQLPDGAVTVEGEVAHRQVRPDGLVDWGVRFAEMSPAARQRLTAYLFITACWEQYVDHRVANSRSNLPLMEPIPEATK